MESPEFLTSFLSSSFGVASSVAFVVDVSPFGASSDFSVFSFSSLTFNVDKSLANLSLLSLSFVTFAINLTHSSNFSLNSVAPLMRINEKVMFFFSIDYNNNRTNTLIILLSGFPKRTQSVSGFASPSA